MEIITVSGCLAAIFFFPCKEPWSQLCLKFAGVMGLISRYLYHIYIHGGVNFLTYYAYFSGEAGGVALGIVLCLLVSRQLGSPTTSLSKKT
jgi:hypothetical protein